MTLQTVRGLFYPDPAAYGTLVLGTTTFLSFLLDSAAEKLAFVFRVPKTGNLARIGFRTATVTTGDTLRVSFQDVSAADGHPDGGVDQFRTVTVLDANDNTWFRSGLVTNDGTDNGSLRAVTRGQVVAAVIDFSSFVAGSLNIAAKQLNASVAPWVGLNYVDHFTASWSKGANSCAVIAIEYDDGTFAFIPNSFPCETNVVSGAINAGTTPDEVALRFRLGGKARVSGFWIASNLANDTDVILYDSDGTSALASVTLDKDQQQPAPGGMTSSAGLFASSLTLSANTWYRLAVKPAGSVTLLSFTVPATPGAAQLDQMSGGRDMHWSERTDLGAWDDTQTTKRPLFGLIFDGLDDGSGGGVSSLLDTGLN